MMPTFPDRLRQAMDGRGWNQTDLARASGVPQTTISRYLRQAEDKPRHKVWQLARALGQSIDWLDKGLGEMVNEAGSWSDPTAALLNFAERLKGARRDVGFASAKDAAKAAGVEPARWAAFEAAKGWPDASEMLQIMQALGISLDYLIAGVGLPGPGANLRAPDAGFLHDKATSKER